MRLGKYCEAWAAKDKEPLSRVDNPSGPANAQKNCRPHSSANLDLPANRFKNGVDVKFQYRRIGLITSLIGGHRMRTAQDDIKRTTFVGGIARTMGTVSPWIRRAKNGHCRRSKSDGEMQR